MLASNDKRTFNNKKIVMNDITRTSRKNKLPVEVIDVDSVVVILQVIHR